MSTTRPSSRRSRARVDETPTRDISRLRARRREARRRRRLLRVDLGLGVFGAIVLLVVASGVAMAAILALVVLLLCVLSIVVERRVRRRSMQPQRRRRNDRANPIRVARSVSRAPETTVRDGRRSSP